MSFTEDCLRFGDRLAKLVDAGVPVRDAAVSLGMSRQRCYAILRAVGRPVGSSRPGVGEVERARVVAVFTATGSVNQAAKASGVSHSCARRLLVAAGLVSATRQPRGKAEAKRRFLELIELGWPVVSAAREVGVNERTARDWRDGIRQTAKTRIHPDGTVVDYRVGARYIVGVPRRDISATGRYLSLQNLLAIADGLVVGQSLTQIAARIGRHKSTVSREVRAHRVDGLYLPHHADRMAATARARPSSPNWWSTRPCGKR